MISWLPMITAPLDGTRVLLYRCGQPVMGYWSLDQYVRRPVPFWWDDNALTRGIRETRSVPPLAWADVSNLPPWVIARIARED